MAFCFGTVLLTFVISAFIYLINRWYRRDFVSDFVHKYIFITGCDSGFGNQLALDLDALGVHVYAGCYTTVGAEKLKAKASQRLKTIHVDVTDRQSVENAKKFVEDDLPAGKNLWGVVNNAGILGNSIFDIADTSDYRQLLDVNFFGCITVVEVFSSLIKKSRGRFVQVASIFGRGCMAAAPYTCSKHAIEPYTDELRRYMRKFGVKVSTIEPGCVATSIFDDAVYLNVLKRKFEALPNDVKQQFEANFVERESKLLYKVFGDHSPAKWNKVQDIVDAMTHSLLAVHPKTRYTVGYDARLYIFLVNFTPDWFLDGLIRLLVWWAGTRINV